jgi:hypothetical protein
MRASLMSRLVLDILLVHRLDVNAIFVILISSLCRKKIKLTQLIKKGWSTKKIQCLKIIYLMHSQRDIFLRRGFILKVATLL